MGTNWTLSSGERGLASIIVTAYNQEPFLGETLQSVLAQTYRPIECVVIDDGSSDGTSKITAEFAGRKEQGIAIRCIRQQNQGAQAARNNGLAVCRGEYIQHLDGDDLLAKDKIQTQVDFLASDAGKNFDVVYGDANFLVRGNGGFQIAEEIGIGPSNDFLASLLTGRFNPPFAYLSRRSAIRACGPWDPVIPINQDFEYFLRMACRGARFGYVSAKTGLYRKHSGPRISDQGMLLRGRTTLEILKSAERTAEAAGQLTHIRRRAFAKYYWNVSCWMFDLDQATWRSSLQESMRVCPDFRPEGVVRRGLQSVMGIRPTETLLGTARRLKRLFGRQAA